MCTAQCGSMEAKALSFVLRAASSEHYKSSTRRVLTYVAGGRLGMNDTCYFTLDMKKLVPTPPHPIPCDVCPKCRISHVCKCKRTSASPPHPIPCDACPKCRVSHVCKFKRTSASPPHPTPSHVMCAQSVESHMCASAKERQHPHPTPSHVMCRQSVESHMCASAKERHESPPPYPVWFMPKVTLFYAQSDPLECSPK